jgi:hypothetical protein
MSDICATKIPGQGYRLTAISNRAKTLLRKNWGSDVLLVNGSEILGLIRMLEKYVMVISIHGDSQKPKSATGEDSPVSKESR